MLFTGVGFCCGMSSSASERQVYLVGKLCPDQTFLSLCHRRHAAAQCMLYKINSNSNHCCPLSFHLLLSEFDIPELHPIEFEVSSVEYSNLQGVSCRLRLVGALRKICGTNWLKNTSLTVVTRLTRITRSNYLA